MLHATRIGLYAILFSTGQADDLQQFCDALSDDVRIDLIQLSKVTQIVQAAQATVQTFIAAKSESDMPAYLAGIAQNVKP